MKRTTRLAGRRGTTRAEKDGDDEAKTKRYDRTRRKDEQSSEASRGANINATPQTADVAPITNLTPVLSASLHAGNAGVRSATR